MGCDKSIWNFIGNPGTLNAAAFNKQLTSIKTQLSEECGQQIVQTASYYHGDYAYFRFESEEAACMALGDIQFHGTTFRIKTAKKVPGCVDRISSSTNEEHDGDATTTAPEERKLLRLEKKCTGSDLSINSGLGQMGGGGIVVGGQLTSKCTRREDAAGVPTMMAGGGDDDIDDNDATTTRTTTTTTTTRLVDDATTTTRTTTTTTTTRLVDDATTTTTTNTNTTTTRIVEKSLAKSGLLSKIAVLERSPGPRRRSATSKVERLSNVKRCRRNPPLDEGGRESTADVALEMRTWNEIGGRRKRERRRGKKTKTMHRSDSVAVVSTSDFSVMRCPERNGSNINSDRESRRYSA
jgi:hypothetical protein